MEMSFGFFPSIFFFETMAGALLVQLRRKNLCTRKVSSTRCQKEASEGLTNPRDVVEHKHDTLRWVIVA
jgi:hypothetical protein